MTRTFGPEIADGASRASIGPSASPSWAARAGQAARIASRSGEAEESLWGGGGGAGRSGGAGFFFRGGGGGGGRAGGGGLLFWGGGGRRRGPRFQGGQAADQVAQLGEVLEPGDADQGQLDEQAAMRAAPEPSPGLGQDLQRREDRVER